MKNEALRLFRVFHDLKLNKMAEKLEVSPSYLSEIEKGHREVSLKLIEKYAKVFETSPSAILAFSEKLGEDATGLKATIAKKIVGLLQNIEKYGAETK